MTVTRQLVEGAPLAERGEQNYGVQIVAAVVPSGTGQGMHQAARRVLSTYTPLSPAAHA